MDFPSLIIAIVELVAGAAIVLLSRLFSSPGLEIRGAALLAGFLIALNALIFGFLMVAVAFPALQANMTYGLAFSAFASAATLTVLAASIPYLHRYFLPLGGKELAGAARALPAAETAIFLALTLPGAANILSYIGADPAAPPATGLLGLPTAFYSALVVAGYVVLSLSWAYPLFLGFRHRAAAKPEGVGFLSLPVLISAALIPPASILEATGVARFAAGNAAAALFLCCALRRVYAMLRASTAKRGGASAVPASLELSEEAANRLAGREREIAELLLRGMANKDIARELGISYSTTKNYIFSLFKKLGINSRFEVLRFAKNQ